MKKFGKVIMDLDGVLQDLEIVMLQILNKERGTNYELKDGPNWNLFPLFKDREEFVAFFRAHRDEILGTAPAYDGAKEFFERVEALAKEFNYEFVFFSNLLDYSDASIKFQHTLELFGKRIAALLKVGMDKSTMFDKGDFVIDDSPKNLERARNAMAFPICIARPWNQQSSNPSWEGKRFLNFEAAYREISRVMTILRGNGRSARNNRLRKIA